MAEHIDYTSEV